eukprot:TRINITY_DN2357_c0_g1_i3.p1 TRINITY_DN2357_c0_g1~~TRINITY_DN2357_c0_g1_i3.p1  ORF type:complete len:706 (-),score=111.85 TRINITY_DN2357_c0_g1_i3:84-2201(-)
MGTVFLPEACQTHGNLSTQQVKHLVKGLQDTIALKGSHDSSIFASSAAVHVTHPGECTPYPKGHAKICEDMGHNHLVPYDIGHSEKVSDLRESNLESAWAKIRSNVLIKQILKHEQCGDAFKHSLCLTAFPICDLRYAVTPCMMACRSLQRCFQEEKAKVDYPAIMASCKELCQKKTCGLYKSGCPPNHLLRRKAMNIVGDTSGECCEESCALFNCPDKTAPIKDASSTPGDSKEQCCQSTCATFSCPSGMELKENAATITELHWESCCVSRQEVRATTLSTGQKIEKVESGYYVSCSEGSTALHIHTFSKGGSQHKLAWTYAGTTYYVTGFPDGYGIWERYFGLLYWIAAVVPTIAAYWLAWAISERSDEKYARDKQQHACACATITLSCFIGIWVIIHVWIQHPARYEPLMLTASGHQVTVGFKSSGFLQILDLSQKEFIHNISVNVELTSISQGQHFLASGASDGTVHVYQSSNWRKLTTLRDAKAKMETLAWSMDSNPFLATGSAAGEIRIYQSRVMEVAGISMTNFMLAKLLRPKLEEEHVSLLANNPSRSIQAVAWSSRYLAAGCAAGGLYLYEVGSNFTLVDNKAFAKLKNAKGFVNHEKGSLEELPVTSLAWSSRYLAVGLQNSTANIYDVNPVNHRLIHVSSLTEATGAISRVAWAGNRLAVSADSKIRVYDSSKDFELVDVLTLDDAVTSFTVAY